MQLTFLELRAKEVINTQDGRKLGRVCDMVFCYPDNRWVGIVVPGGKGWVKKKNELFIDLKKIVKIGEDVVLVNVGLPKKQEDGKRVHGMPVFENLGINSYENPANTQRNYEEFE